MSLLSGIVNFFKKLWDMIKKILVYILIAIAVFILLWAIFATGGALLPIIGVALTTTQCVVAALACLAGAFLIDSDTAKSVTDSIAGAVGDATEAVADVATSAAGGAVSGILGSDLFLYAALGIGAYFLLTAGSKEQSPVVYNNPSSVPEKQERDTLSNDLDLDLMEA